MNTLEHEAFVQEEPTRTLPVLGLLTCTALVFSYLGAYGLSSALLAADLIAPWPVEQDPRPEWMLKGFLSILAGLIVMSGFLRWLSKRQIRRIDAMADEEA